MLFFTLMVGNLQRTGFSMAEASLARATRRVRQLEHMMECDGKMGKSGEIKQKLSPHEGNRAGGKRLPREATASPSSEKDPKWTRPVELLYLGLI